MGYQYDVFLSYLHERPCGTWVAEHFLPYFRHQLGNALGGTPASIFFDRTGIHTGQRWPARLKQALGHSRCLVGVWSPLYFQSEWCRFECAIMQHRERQLGLTGTNPDGLIAGVKVNDGIHFPEFAAASQYADFEHLFYDGPGFAKSELYVDFQRDVAKLSLDVATLISKAPAWSPEWLTAAWTDDVIANLGRPVSPAVAQPLLAP
jgi:TIR domain